MAEVTTCADPTELAAALGPIFGYFGASPDEGVGERFARVLPPERMHVAREDGLVVAGGGAFPFELTVPGGATVRAAGVTVVGVLPTHRRRGLLRSLMRAQLDDVHARGEPVSVPLGLGRRDLRSLRLRPGRDGGRDRLPARARAPGAAPARGEPTAALGRGGARADPAALRPAAARASGHVLAHARLVEVRRLSDPPERRGGAGELVHVLLEQDGEPAGYALYRHKVSFVDGLSDSQVVIREALAADEATPALWRYLLEIDWVARSRPTCFRSTTRCSSWPRGRATCA